TGSFGYAAPPDQCTKPPRAKRYGQNRAAELDQELAAAAAGLLDHAGAHGSGHENFVKDVGQRIAPAQAQGAEPQHNHQWFWRAAQDFHEHRKQPRPDPEDQPGPAAKTLVQRAEQCAQYRSDDQEEYHAAELLGALGG